MNIANFMLNAAHRQYEHHMNKLMKNKYRPVPKYVDMFNFQSNISNNGYGFVLYKQMIDKAFHPVIDYENHKIIVWDVAFFYVDYATRDLNFQLHVGCRLSPELAEVFQFKTEHERNCFCDHIEVKLNDANHMINIKYPSKPNWSAIYGQLLRKEQLQRELKSCEDHQLT